MESPCRSISHQDLWSWGTHVGAACYWRTAACIKDPCVSNSATSFPVFSSCSPSSYFLPVPAFPPPPLPPLLVLILLLLLFILTPILLFLVFLNLFLFLFLYFFLVFLFLRLLHLLLVFLPVPLHILLPPIPPHFFFTSHFPVTLPSPFPAPPFHLLQFLMILVFLLLLHPVPLPP